MDSRPSPIPHSAIALSPRLPLLALGLLFPALGCRNCDLVEAELRTRESDLRILREELLKSECQNAALVRELGALRQGNPAAVTPEQASQAYSLKQIALGRGTGGYDNDDCPGDEALQVVLEPRDCDGHTIKAPGSLHVAALEINTEGLKTPLSDWDVPPDQLRRFWRSGLFSTGYVLVLPWKNWPTSDKIRVVARFTLADGRLFEADKDVTVRLTPAAYRKPASPADILTPLSPEPASVPVPTLQKIPLQPNESSPSLGSPAPIQQANLWRPKAPPSLADAVQLTRPTPLPYAPGEGPES